MVIEFRHRKAQAIKKSLWISLPYEWAAHHNLEKGSRISVELAEGGDALLIRPEKAEAE